MKHSNSVLAMWQYFYDVSRAFPLLAVSLYDYVGTKGEGCELTCLSILVLDDKVVAVAECLFTFFGCKDPFFMGLIMSRMRWNTIT